MKEQDLFDFLKSSLYPDLEKAPGIYDAFDCVSATAGHYIELKCRYTHYDTLLIEEMKYRKLITQALVLQESVAWQSLQSLPWNLLEMHWLHALNLVWQTRQSVTRQSYLWKSDYKLDSICAKPRKPRRILFHIGTASSLHRQSPQHPDLECSG